MLQTPDPHNTLIQLSLNQLNPNITYYKIQNLKNKIGSALQTQITEGKINLNDAQEIAYFLSDNFTDTINQDQFNQFLIQLKQKFPLTSEILKEK